MDWKSGGPARLQTTEPGTKGVVSVDTESKGSRVADGSGLERAIVLQLLRDDRPFESRAVRNARPFRFCVHGNHSLRAGLRRLKSRRSTRFPIHPTIHTAWNGSAWWARAAPAFLSVRPMSQDAGLFDARQLDIPPRMAASDARPPCRLASRP